MIWLLDTNACIRYLNGLAPKLKQTIDATSPDDIVVCSVVKAELAYGAARSSDPVRTSRLQEYFVSRFRSLPFDDTAAKVYGPIRAQLAALGTPIGPNDLLIASIAVANGATMVTHNLSEFRRVNGLVAVDWEV